MKILWYVWEYSFILSCSNGIRRETQWLPLHISIILDMTVDKDIFLSFFILLFSGILLSLALILFLHLIVLLYSPEQKMLIDRERFHHIIHRLFLSLPLCVFISLFLLLTPSIALSLSLSLPLSLSWQSLCCFCPIFIILW